MRAEEVMAGGTVAAPVLSRGRHDILGEKGHSVEEVEGVVAVADSHAYDEHHSCMLEVEDSREEVLEAWAGSGSRHDVVLGSLVEAVLGGIPRVGADSDDKLEDLELEVVLLEDMARGSDRLHLMVDSCSQAAEEGVAQAEGHISL
jgi:hypothetical protein